MSTKMTDTDWAVALAWRALRERFGKWNSVWKRFDRLRKAGVFETFFAKALYKGRARIEQAVGKLKRFRRVALRCKKTARNFLSFVHLSAAFILSQAVHMV